MDKLNIEQDSLYDRLNRTPHWFALKTRSRHEVKVEHQLKQKGIECFLPTYESIRYWSDRKKKIELPLFSCYLFVKITLKEKMNALQTDGAVHFVVFENMPAPIPDYQINSLKKIIDNKMPIAHVNDWSVGQKVEVKSGPLKGVQGKIQKIKNKSQLIVLIDALSQAVSVEIDDKEVKLFY